MMKALKNPLMILGVIFLAVGLINLAVFGGIYRAMDEMDIVYRVNGVTTRQPDFPRWLPFLAFALVGGIFAALGACFLLTSWRKRARRRWLEANGVPVKAKVTGVSQSMHVTVNSRHPYVVKAVFTHPYTGVEMEAKSGYLMEDPSPLVQDGTVEVLVDPMREKRYCMRIGEFFPARADFQ